MNSRNLKLDLYNKTISSPLIVGSGTLIERYEQIEPYMNNNVGLIVPRTTRKHMVRRTHPVPHLYQTGSRKYPVMLNAEWTGADIAYWQPYLKSLAKSDKMVMSISGRNIDDCVDVCLELEKHPGWIYYEINLSCAHSNDVHGMITRSKQHIVDVVTALKKSGIKTPIVIKLGHSDHIIELCTLAESAGADGLVLLNTYGPVFDFTIDHHGHPNAVVGIEGGKGGLSGSPLFHMALTDVAMVSQTVSIPIIACGGVCSAEDVIKMLMAGARAVQIYTAAHAWGVNAPEFFKKIHMDLIKYMEQHAIKNLSSIIGKALPLLKTTTNLAVDVPIVNEDTCIGCNLCIPICLPNAISIKPKKNANTTGHVVSIDTDACVGCGHCLHACPTKPNSLEMQSLSNKKNIITDILTTIT